TIVRSRDPSTTTLLNLPPPRMCTVLQSQPSLAAIHPVVSEPVIAHLVVSVPQALFRLRYFQPGHPARIGIPPIRPTRNQNDGSRHHTRPISSPPRAPVGCAGARRFQDSRIWNLRLKTIHESVPALPAPRCPRERWCEYPRILEGPRRRPPHPRSMDPHMDSQTPSRYKRQHRVRRLRLFL